MDIFVLAHMNTERYIFKKTRERDAMVVNGKRMTIEDARVLYKQLVIDGYHREDGYAHGRPAKPLLSPDDYESMTRDAEYEDPVSINHPRWDEYDLWAGENYDNEASYQENSAESEIFSDEEDYPKTIIA